MARNLRQLLDAVLDGVIVVGADERVEQINAQASRILLTSPDAAEGRRLAELVGADVLAPVALAAAERGNSSVAHEQRIQRRLGSEVCVDVAASPLLDSQGRNDGVVLLLRDRTISDALRGFWDERERTESLGRIAAGIAHEVKNPLGGIRGAAELLAARAADDKTRQTAELIVRESARIATLLDDFLIFARESKLRLQAVNLHESLDDALGLLAMDPLGTRAKVVRRFDPSIPEILADGNRLMQVWLNLARNALEAMDDSGGTLTISTRMSLDHRLDAGAGRVPTVLVEIHDTGHGIPESLIGQVTSPFFTTKPSGTGLGLALVRHFVALHDGGFQIRSEPGEGTRARVRLPLRRAQ